MKILGLIQLVISGLALLLILLVFVRCQDADAKTKKVVPITFVKPLKIEVRR